MGQPVLDVAGKRGLDLSKSAKRDTLPSSWDAWSRRFLFTSLPADPHFSWDDGVVEHSLDLRLLLGLDHHAEESHLLRGITGGTGNCM